MKKAISLGLLGLTAWAFFMLVHLPASFGYQMAPVPANVSASNITGTVWSGKVGVLTVDNVSLTSVNWSLKPMALLGQALEADITVGDLQSPVSAEATVRATRSDIQLENATVDVAAQWLQSNVPVPDFVMVDVSGNINLNIESMNINQQGCQSLTGDVTLERSTLDSPFGAVRMGSAGAQLNCSTGALTALLNQTSDDLVTEGQFTLQPNRQFDVAATLTPGSELPDSLKQGLKMLGQPNPDSSYSLDFSGRL